jgi:hypothetical protein
LSGARYSTLDNVCRSTQRTNNAFSLQRFRIVGQTVGDPGSRPSHGASVGLRICGYCLAVGVRHRKTQQFPSGRVLSAIDNQHMWQAMPSAFQNKPRRLAVILNPRHAVFEPVSRSLYVRRFSEGHVPRGTYRATDPVIQELRQNECPALALCAAEPHKT